MNLDEYKCRVLVDNILLENRYMDYIAGIKTPDLTSRICIQIPSFCDEELLSTIQSFRENAANPERLTFAVCLQDDDTKLLRILEEDPRCLVSYFKKDEAPGLCAARYACNQLLTDEDYVLHTDSHMRAAKYWDTAFLAMWGDCQDEKAILSSYPLDYAAYKDLAPGDDVFTSGIKDEGSFVGIVSNINVEGTVRFKGCDQHAKPVNRKGMFLSGGCVFAKADLDRVCPSDPQMFFVADEICMDVRYFTHGYTVYHPAYMPLWHWYGDRVDKHGKPVVRFNTRDSGYIQKRVQEERRIRSLLRMIPDTVDLKEFDLGPVRSFEEFLEVSGIDFMHHAVRGFARSGHFFRDDATLQDADKKWHYYPSSETVMKPHVCETLSLPEVEKEAYKTICVQIPSYQDPALVTTIQSLLYQADAPYRIHFALCIQGDAAQARSVANRFPNVTYRCIPLEETTGTGMARACCQELYDHEDYILITDAHMLAIKHWDTMLIRQLEQIPDQRAVISAQAPDFGPARGRDFWRGCFDMPYGLHSFGIDSFVMDDAPNGLYNNHYMSVLKEKYDNCGDFDTYVKSFGITGGHTFARGRFNRDVRYSGEAAYRGDECMTSVIAFTKGYNVYTYWNGYLLHDSYATHKRPVHDAALKAYQTEREAMLSLLRSGKTKSMHLGTERSLTALSHYLGVDFKNLEIFMRAYTREPGQTSEEKKSIGSVLFEKDVTERCRTKIYVVAAFGETTAVQNMTDNYLDFRHSLLEQADRPENVVLCAFHVTDGHTYGYHVNHFVETLNITEQDILLFVDGAVRFLPGWDDALVKDFMGMNPYMIWSCNTYASEQKTAYPNPAVVINYDYKASDVHTKTQEAGPVFIHQKPVLLRGVMAMRAGVFYRVPFDPVLSYADHNDTYGLRLYTHGYDIYYNRLSYLYRTHLVTHLDGITKKNQMLKQRLFGSLYQEFEETWSNYAYGTGKKRSVISWFRQFGFKDTNRSSKGTAVF